MSEFIPESSPESGTESGNVSSSGVYKSKLFNFLNRRSQELMHQSKTVLRHLQVATIWGVQIALYPVYLLIQTGRNFAWQLQASAARRESRTIGNQVDNQPILPSSDQPITQVLELVKEFLPEGFFQVPILETSHFGNNNLSIYSDYQLSTQIEQDTSLTLINNTSPHSLRQSHDNTQPLSQGEIEKHGDNLSTILSRGEDGLAQVGLYVQGIANLLTSRKLVLVGNNNQILDIMTPEQQQKLAKKIIWEIAGYGYDRHRFFQAQNQSQRTFSPPLPNPQSPQTLLPAKWFWKLMAWVQRGEVAMAANLFQESSLALVAPSINSSSASINSLDNSSTNLLKIFSAIDFSSLPISSATLQIVDQQVYEIEIKQITPASQWLTHLGEKLLPLVVAPQQVLSRYKHQGIDQGITNGIGDSLENNPANSRENIWALIQGAIAYFFGQKSPEEISANFSPNQSHDQGNYEGNYALDSATPHAFYPGINLFPTYQELPFSEDDWLTSEDLFKVVESQESNNYEDQDMLDLPSTLETKLLSATNHPSLAQVMAQKKKKPRSPSQAPLAKKNTPSNTSKNITKKSAGTNPRAIANKSSAPKPAKSAKPIAKYRDVEYGISNSCDISSDLDNNSGDWIETEVTSRGYVKHPLQKCLEILDDLTLWIEEFLGRIWQAIKKIVKA